VNQKSIHGHCNKRHGWSVGKDNPTYWTKVKVQTFFGIGSQRYFIVDSQAGDRVTSVGTEALDPNSTNVDEEIRDQLVKEFDELDRKGEERHEIADLKTEKSDNTG
jgi:hypothetical protein